MPRNVAEHVDRVASAHQVVDTYSEDEVSALLAKSSDDRIGHAWELALSGLRRGEIAGLRWIGCRPRRQDAVDREQPGAAGGKPVENDPKSATSRRTLPLPDRLVIVLKTAKARQAAERLALGSLSLGRIWCPTRSAIRIRRRCCLPLLAGRGEGCRGTAHQAARRPAHLRDSDASARDSRWR